MAVGHFSVAGGGFVVYFAVRTYGDATIRVEVGRETGHDRAGAHGGGDAVLVWKHVEPSCGMHEKRNFQEFGVVRKLKVGDDGAVALLESPDGALDFGDMFVVRCDAEADCVEGK